MNAGHDESPASASVYSLAHRPNGSFHPRTKAQFLQHLLHMYLDRAFGDVQLAGDHLVAVTGSDGFQYLLFTIGQRIDRGRAFTITVALADRLCQRAAELFADGHLAGSSALDGSQQL